MVPNSVLYYYNVINLIQQFGSKILLGGFHDFIFDFFSIFSQNSFHTNAPGWCLMKCINYNRLAKCSSTSRQDSCQEFQDFSTVQDNSRSYQGFQEVTGICGKIQDLGKSFKIFYTGYICFCPAFVSVF